MNAAACVTIMPCLDMQDGRVVKGVRFVEIQDAGDPVACCQAYCRAGADEIALLDIAATIEGRGTLLDVVRRVAEVATARISSAPRCRAISATLPSTRIVRSMASFLRRCLTNSPSPRRTMILCWFSIV